MGISEYTPFLNFCPYMTSQCEYPVLTFVRELQTKPHSINSAICTYNLPFFQHPPHLLLESLDCFFRLSIRFRMVSTFLNAQGFAYLPHSLSIYISTLVGEKSYRASMTQYPSITISFLMLSFLILHRYCFLKFRKQVHNDEYITESY